MLLHRHPVNRTLFDALYIIKNISLNLYQWKCVESFHLTDNHLTQNWFHETNFRFQFAGVAAVGFGYWLLAEKGKIITDGMYFFFDPAVMSMVNGCVIFSVAFFGCLGALRENILLLKVVRALENQHNLGVRSTSGCKGGTLKKNWRSRVGWASTAPLLKAAQGPPQVSCHLLFLLVF